MKLTANDYASILKRLATLEAIAAKWGMDNTAGQKPIKIDMSVCIDSRVDIERYSGKHHVWQLCQNKFTIDEFNGFVAEGNMYRPRFNHPHASHKGWAEKPIPDGFDYLWWGVRRNGSSDDSQVVHWGDCRIFEITGIQENYTL